MLPVLAIVGRPNVGKSTLFNCLTGTRDALVADAPGLTRDRRYGTARAGERGFIVVDTGGLDDEPDPMTERIAAQALRAVSEADLVLFMVDGRAGLTPADQQIATRLRQSAKPMILVVNKTDGLDVDLAAGEFHALGMGEPVAIAASHGRGVQHLARLALDRLPPAEDAAPAPEDAGVTVAVLGRPNVGKSTLINRLLGEERLVAHDAPGTTRDSIYVPFTRHGRAYTLVDTAGLRRRARVAETIEKLSAVKTLQAIASANVVVVLVDAREGLTDQDAHLLGLAVEAGRALVIAVNKWDGLAPDQRDRVRESVHRKLPFVDFARVLYISALHGTGVGDLVEAVDEAWEAASRDLSTQALNRVLGEAVQRHAPPLVRGRRIRLRYAHQGGRNPPIIVVHGNQTEHVPDAYKRYLMRTFREAFALAGTPVRLEFKTGENPYKGRRNPLTERQQRRRKRLMRHVKKGR